MKKKITYGIFVLIILVNIFYMFSDFRANSKVVKYNGNNLLISIDGVNSSSLPTSGNYYLVDYDCSNLNTKITWDKSNSNLNVTSKNAGVSCNLEFKSNPLLSEMPVGSYVEYEGNNGCEGNHCLGYNANYESEDRMGYCGDSNYQFYVNGWRLGYIDEGASVLISAGAPECMCTSSDGSPSNSSCDVELSSSDINKHYDNMKNTALKYCNSSFIKNGECDSNAIDNNYVKVMDANVFSTIMNKTLSSNSCSAMRSDKSCGYNNDLIDTGSYYWIGTQFNSTSSNTFLWSANVRSVYSMFSRGVNGVRPVLTLDSSVIVTGGSGTYDDPYTIDNNYFIVGDGTGILDSNNDLSNVSVSLNSVGDVSKMCISVDTSSCTDYIDYSNNYSLNLSSESAGEKIIYVYYKDAYSKIIATMQRVITIE